MSNCKGLLLSLLLLLVGVVQVACGGGGGGRNNSGSTAPTALTYSANPAVYTKDVAITANTPTVIGGAATSFAVSPALPAGLSLDPTTGVITGRPTIASVATSYIVTATIAAGNANVTLSITVTSTPVAPTITTQPLANQTVSVGTSVSFTVDATGTEPLAYQWFRDATPIPAATNATYTTSVMTDADNGTVFTVVVANAAGSVTSAPATLTVDCVSGLRNADGTPHVIPAAHPTAGRVITITNPPYSADNTGHADAVPAIEAALASAVAGDEIFFPDGTYLLASVSSSYQYANIWLKNGINLRGQSETGVVLRSTLISPNTSTTNYAIFGKGVQDVAISNLTISSTWTGAYSTSTTVNNPEAGGPAIALAFRNWSNDPVAIAGARITVDHVTVEKFRLAGILVGNGCRDTVISNCSARNATDLGGGGAGYGFVITGFGPQSAATNPFEGTVKDAFFNKISGCRADGPYIRHGIILSYWAHNNLVTDCVANGTQIDAIDLHGEDEYANEIRDNTITGVVNEAGIARGNTGATHDRTGPDNLIHHNSVSQSKFGIVVELGTDRQRIENNIISHCTRGVGLGKTDGTLVLNNRVENCGTAVYFYINSAINEVPAGGTTHCRVTGNTFSGNTTDISRASNVTDESWSTNTIGPNP